ncbi:MAG: hypothetical protein AAGD32_16795 [Planctomycetota bacterium]
MALILCLALQAETSSPPDTGRFLIVAKYEHQRPPKPMPRLRVSGPGTVLHKWWKNNGAVFDNGLATVDMPVPPHEMIGAELVIEMWGGHSMTPGKRVSLNGRSTYMLPDPFADVPEEAGFVKVRQYHAFPRIELKRTDLVRGVNAIQFACDQPVGEEHFEFGHFLVDNVAVHAELPADHALVADAGLSAFTATVTTDIDAETVRLGLDLPADFDASVIKHVDYYTNHAGFDETGDADSDWHGYEYQGKFVGGGGRVSAAPFVADWDTSMIPDSGSAKVRAVVHFENNVRYETPIATVDLPAKPAVTMVHVDEPIGSMWARDDQVETRTLTVDVDPAEIDRAELHLTLWDGGVEEVEHPFHFNGHPLPVDSPGHHDARYLVVPIDIAWLKQGANEIRLTSDTKHHGIEVLYPGAVLMLRMK